MTRRQADNPVHNLSVSFFLLTTDLKAGKDLSRADAICDKVRYYAKSTVGLNIDFFLLARSEVVL